MVVPEESVNPFKTFDDVKYKMPMPEETKSKCWFSRAKQYVNEQLHLDTDTVFRVIPLMGLVASFITFGTATQAMMRTRMVDGLSMVWYSLAFLVFCTIQVKWASDGYKNPGPLFLWINSKGFEWILTFAALMVNPYFPYTVICSLLLTFLTVLMCIGHSKFTELQTRNANAING